MLSLSLMGPENVDDGMFGSRLALKGAKKIKKRYGWKGLAVAAVAALVGRRILRKKRSGGNGSDET